MIIVLFKSVYAQYMKIKKYFYVVNFDYNISMSQVAILFSIMLVQFST